MQTYVTPVLIFWICVHIGFSLTQVADHFLFGRNQVSVTPNYEESFIQSNRLRGEIDLTDNQTRMQFISDDFGADNDSEKNIATRFMCQFTFFGTILDFIAKIYALDYEFFTSYEEEIRDSVVSWILQGFRLASIIFGLTFTIQIIILIFQSGILTAGSIATGGAIIGIGVISNIFEKTLC